MVMIILISEISLAWTYFFPCYSFNFLKFHQLKIYESPIKNLLLFVIKASLCMNL